MKRNKLLSLLTMIDRKSLRYYEKYLHACYNKDQKPTLLFNYLKKFYPEFNHKDLHMAGAFCAVYGKDIEQALRENPKSTREKQTKLVSNLFNDLLTILKEYLSLSYLKNNPLELERTYTKALRFHQFPEHFEKQLNAYDRKIAKIKQEDIWYHLRALENKHFRYFHNITPKNSVKETTLQSALEELDALYLSIKLRYASELATRSEVIDAKLVQGITAEIENLVKNSPRLTDFQQVYHFTYLMLQTKDENYFNQLFKIIKSNEVSVTDFELRIIFTYMANYTADRIRYGEKSFIRKSFELNKIALDRKWLIKEDTFSPFKFLNIISLGCLLQEFKWLSLFIKEWAPFLAEEARKNTLAFSDAYIAFAKKDYSAALDDIALIPTKDAIINLRSRILKIQCYIMMKEFDRDFIIDYWNTSYKYFKNNKNLGENIRQSALNTLKVIQKILFQSSPSDKLRLQIQKQDLLFSREWLQQLIILMDKGAIVL